MVVPCFPDLVNKLLNSRTRNGCPVLRVFGLKPPLELRTIFLFLLLNFLFAPDILHFYAPFVGALCARHGDLGTLGKVEFWLAL